MLNYVDNYVRIKVKTEGPLKCQIWEDTGLVPSSASSGGQVREQYCGRREDIYKNPRRDVNVQLEDRQIPVGVPDVSPGYIIPSPIPTSFEKRVL